MDVVSNFFEEFSSSISSLFDIVQAFLPSDLFLLLTSILFLFTGISVAKLVKGLIGG